MSSKIQYTNNKEPLNISSNQIIRMNIKVYTFEHTYIVKVDKQTSNVEFIETYLAAPKIWAIASMAPECLCLILNKKKLTM